MIGPIAEAKGKAKPARPRRRPTRARHTKVTPELHPPDPKPRQEVDHAADAHDA